MILSSFLGMGSSERGLRVSDDLCVVYMCAAKDGGIGINSSCESRQAWAAAIWSARSCRAMNLSWHAAISSSSGKDVR